MLISVQLLRGFAALLVVLHHIAFKERTYGVSGFDWLHIGGSGVDLFFIISGFIMCYSTHDKNITFGKFIALRVERILPLYWFFTTVALAVFIVAPQVVNSSGGTTSILDSYLLIPTGNKYLVQNGWTLSYEFYYYFAFSVFIFLIKDRSLRYLSTVFSLCLLATLGFVLQPEDHILKFIFSSWLYEFAMGVISFYILRKYKIGTGLGTALLSIGLALLIYKNNNMDAFSTFPGALSVGVPMWLVFTGLVSLESWFKNKTNVILKFGILLGYSSYSLYLIHPFVLSPAAMILKKLHLTVPYLFGFGMLIPALASGIIGYLYLEKPMVKFFKEKRQRVLIR